MSGDVLVEVKNLSRSYGETRAVQDVSFTLHKGEVVGFLGPNGAGKTTTMQILTGNLAPGDGEIIIDGHDLLEEPRAAKAQIGYLPEIPPLYRDQTVDEFLDYCAQLNRIPSARWKAAREEAKGKCGLTQVGERLVGNLSKGYQQRVGIAQAIIHLPPVVVLDEPTSGLDPIQIREIRQLIRDLGRDHGVILSTHILSEVQFSCNRVLIINRGKLVLSASIEDLTQHIGATELKLGLRHPPALKELEKISGVVSVKATDEQNFRVVYRQGQDPIDEIVRQAAAKNWGLNLLAPGTSTLEDVFVGLLKSDNQQHEKDA